MIGSDSWIVYMHIFPNNKKYIGITSRKVEDRWKNGLGYFKNKQEKMKNAIQKYGWENIKHVIVAKNLSKEEACKLEIELIKKFNTTNLKFGYNTSTGGASGSCGVVWTEEQRKKLSNSISGEKNAFFGKKHSIDSIKKMQKSRKIFLENHPEAIKKGKDSPNYGKKPSKKTNKKRSDSLKNFYKEHPERRKEISLKYSGENHPMFNKKHTEKTKKKMSERKIGNIRSNETRKKISSTIKRKILNNEFPIKYKKVMCIETGIIYESVKDAANKLKINYLMIRKACNGERKSYLKQHYKYMN